jgi:hypothetical protein
MYYDIRAQEVK